MKDGLLYCIDALEQKGLFPALRSWSAAAGREDVMLLRFEELVGPNSLHIFRDLFAYCDIRMTDAVLEPLLMDYSFERLSGGRKRGEENRGSNYRKGTPGDWERFFDSAIHTRFKDVTRDLVRVLGYSE